MKGFAMRGSSEQFEGMREIATDQFGQRGRADAFRASHADGPIDLAAPELGAMPVSAPTALAASPGDYQRRRAASGGDALVFIAMSLVSAALGLGLYAHLSTPLGIAILSALMLFVSTSFLHVFVRRMQGVDILDRRVTRLEDQVDHIDEQLRAGAGDARIDALGGLASPPPIPADTQRTSSAGAAIPAAPHPASSDPASARVAEPAELTSAPTGNEAVDDTLHAEQRAAQNAQSFVPDDRAVAEQAMYRIPTDAVGVFANDDPRSNDARQDDLGAAFRDDYHETRRQAPEHVPFDSSVAAFADAPSRGGVRVQEAEDDMLFAAEAQRAGGQGRPLPDADIADTADRNIDGLVAEPSNSMATPIVQSAEREMAADVRRPTQHDHLQMRQPAEREPGVRQSGETSLTSAVAQQLSQQGRSQFSDAMEADAFSQTRSADTHGFGEQAAHVDRPSSPAPIDQTSPPSAPTQMAPTAPASVGFEGLVAEQPPLSPVADALRRATVSGKFEIYLQPILSISDRKVRFFEVLGRIPAAGGQVIAAEEHVEAAREARATVALDHMIFIRAARLVRKLAERQQAQPLFCNISADALSDPAFFVDLNKAAGGLRDIAPYMIVEIDHRTVMLGDQAIATNLARFAGLGFRLSIDRITNPEQAIANGREIDASYLKMPFTTFLEPSMGEAEARERAATIYSVARDSGQTVIVDGVERKEQLAGVVAAGANLGQGYLFSEPKPLLPQVAAEVAGDQAAA
ncbi:MAG: EAL domain-containing protein [Pseudomonadota bacterium]